MMNWLRKPMTGGMAMALIVVGVAQISTVLVDMNAHFEWTDKLKAKFSKKDETENDDSSDERTEEEEA